MLTGFRVLAKLKGLRGTALDVFGRTEERKTERALIGEYRASVEEVLRGLRRQPRLALEIAGLPEQIKRLRPREGAQPGGRAPALGALLQQWRDPQAAARRPPEFAPGAETGRLRRVRPEQPSPRADKRGAVTAYNPGWLARPRPAALWRRPSGGQPQGTAGVSRASVFFPLETPCSFLPPSPRPRPPPPPVAATCSPPHEHAAAGADVRGAVFRDDPPADEAPEGTPLHDRGPGQGRRSRHRRRPARQGHQARRPLPGVEIANGVEVQVQRSAVVQVLPKGTVK
jgi:hypothetical protein